MTGRSQGVAIDWTLLWEWAWSRHHNVLSWYIRPLLVLPYCWFAYRRSVVGMAASVVALLTSMFWFPAPERVEPWVEDFLAAEMAYLTSPWAAAKVALTLTAPAYFVLLGVALWRRSWAWGVAVLAAAAVGKVVWSVLESGDAGWAIVGPAALGLLGCVVGVLVLRRLSARRRTTPKEQ